MYKLGILTNDIKKDFHAAELLEKASSRADIFAIQPKDLEFKICRNVPVIKAGNINAYGLNAVFVRHLDNRFDTELQFDLLKELQQAGILLINSYNSLQIVESKAMTSYLLALYGLPVIECLVTQQAGNALSFFADYGDVVVKPLYSNLGSDLFRLKDYKKPKRIIVDLIAKYGSIYLERYINSGGKDKRVFVVDDHVVAAIERKAQRGFKTSLFQGGKAKNISLSKQLRDMAIKASQILGLDYSGVDIITEDGCSYILELNGSPSWAGVKEATGKDIAAEIVSATIKKLKKYNKTGQFISS